MIGAHLRYLNCFFTCSALLLFTVSLLDVEASNCQRDTIHKKVGDTVEFSSCLPTEGVTVATWRYGGVIIADKDKVFSEKELFSGRLYLNPTNFSLTVRSLTPQDSGDFFFVSEVNDRQRGTVTVTLQVHEAIMKQPILTINSTWRSSNDSCTFLLECSAASNVSHSWTVRNQIRSGSRLQYILSMEDGDTNFTCTIYNKVSQMSTSKSIKCSDETKETKVPSSSGFIVPLFIGVVTGVLLMILPLLCFIKSQDLCCNRLNQSETVKQDETQQQVYSSLLHGDGSVYETMRGSEDAGTDP